MKLNKAMRRLMEKHSICATYTISKNNTYPIWCETDTSGRAYWGVSSFCGLNKNPIPSDEDLSYLEWCGNEICLRAKSDTETTNILNQAIGIVAFWKAELEAKYPETPFYILASYDNGDMATADESQSSTKSMTLRFWAERGNEPIVNLDNFEDSDQPAIIEYCNFAPLPRKFW